MTKFFIPIIILLLFENYIFPQNSGEATTILVVPLKKENIRIKGIGLKMLSYNNISIDSANNILSAVIDKAFNSTFKEFNVQYLNKNIKYKSLNDSLKYGKLFTSQQLQKINESKGLEKVINYNENSEAVLYYGSIINSETLKKLKLVQQEINFKYIVMITEYEITSGGLYILHCELYDENVNRIYGGKTEIKFEMSKKMFFDAAKYFTGQVGEKAFLKLIK